MNDQVRRRSAVGVWIAVIVLAVGAVTVAATSAKQPDLDFQQPGHWVYDADGKAIYHLDGGTKRVDAKTGAVDLAADHTIVQGDGQVMAASGGRVAVFGKSSLAVESTAQIGVDEVPVGLEIVGGPYLVYRQAGTVVRFGGPQPTIVQIGGPVGIPAATDDGAVWAQRTDSAALCLVGRTATQSVCPATAPGNRVGAVAAVGGQALFVDAAAGAVTTIGEQGLGATTSLGVRVAAEAKVAAVATGGRLAIVDTASHNLILADVSATVNGGDAKTPITVDLGEGDFDVPVPTKDAVVLVDRGANRLLTFDVDGKRKATADLPASGGRPKVARGEDGRVYVDTGSGKHTMVVDADGAVAKVAIGKADLPAPPAPQTPPPAKAPVPPAAPPAPPVPRRNVRCRPRRPRPARPPRSAPSQATRW